jgi:hypothetical protein
MARWVKDGLIPEPPPTGYATAAALSRAARSMPAPEPGETATDALLHMREHER